MTKAVVSNPISLKPDRGKPLRFFPPQTMARTLLQGFGAESGIPGSQAPAPGPSASSYGLTQIENNLDDVMQTVIDRVDSMSRDIDGDPHRILEIQGQEIREDVRAEKP